MIRLQEKYQKEVIPQMMKKFGYKNPLAVPKITKLVVNSSFGSLITVKTSDEQKKIREAILNDLTLISGQRPVLTKAKKSISSFKIREGLLIGARATLRGSKMYDLLEKIIYIALPRSRDFQGLEPSSIDKQGNLTIAIKEQIIFPEIFSEKVKNIFGLEITAVTNARNREQGLALLRLLGFPIKAEK